VGFEFLKNFHESKFAFIYASNKDFGLIPSKQQFHELSIACHTDRLAPSLKLVLGNASESRIRGVIDGFDLTLKTAYKNNVKPLPAYSWLFPQTGFKYAKQNAFPEKSIDWIDQEVSWVMQQMEQMLVSKELFIGDRKSILRNLMRQVARRMQTKYFWIGIVAKCLSAYHYPNSPNMGKMREKVIDVGESIEQTLLGLEELEKFADHLPWLPIPDDELFSKLKVLHELLKPNVIKDLTPIKRGDASFMERLFVTQLADGHSRYLNRDDGLPTVIAELFYLDGFSCKIDERNIRRICSEQSDRRKKGKLHKENAYSSAKVENLSQNNRQ
jgi:hypothetical protein